ncbi:unnamed protein product [Arabidopsis arenosa]|uniref:Uncharacterized protein n=1 Tax=Arabidopsis arenosa TaxID=38785 RepID=A0A8S1ZUY4_ARAAE|nr:unnamed protein product [Arabidopsis arenosa]
MSKLKKPILESNCVADKLRDSLNMEDNNNNKPDTINVDLGSPITPLQTRPSGLTSTSSCSSSSSGSVTGHVGHAPVTRKPDSDQPLPSTAKYKSSTPSSAAKSSKSSTTPSAAQFGGSSSPVSARSRSSSQVGAKTGNMSPLSNSGSVTTKPSGNKSSVSSKQHVKIHPAGNLFPSGKVQITGMTQEKPRSMVLGPGAKSYGYGSIMRGNNLSPAKPTMSESSSVLPLTLSNNSSGGPDAAYTSWKIAIYGSNPEEVKRFGNEMFKKGCFTEALKLYDRAIELSPSNATYHSNRAAALSSLGQIGEAVNECEIAIKLDPKFARAHHRLASLLLRLGYVDNAGIHFYSVEEPADPTVVKMLQQPLRLELTLLLRARDRGNDLYELERYTEARSAYAEGLKYDPSNATLLCHRADCFFKVGMWESSIEDCNHALLILPSYTKPLGRWAEVVSDYETLRKELPYDKEIAESLFHAQVALKKSRGEVVLTWNLEVKLRKFLVLKSLKAALTRPGK